jgi:YHS domain-containing protein
MLPQSKCVVLSDAREDTMTLRRTILQMLVATTVIGGVPAVAADRLALKGYDPVAYFTDSKATPGTSEFEYVWDGQRYRFASAQHRNMFITNPDKYAPQFGGSCAMNMSNGLRRESDPNFWVISNGSLYVFAGSAGMERFRQDPNNVAARAVSNWKIMKATATQ